MKAKIIPEATVPPGNTVFENPAIGLKFANACADWIDISATTSKVARVEAKFLAFWVKITYFGCSFTSSKVIPACPNI